MPSGVVLAPSVASLPSLTGPIGLLRTSTADIGPLHQLRFGLHGEYFGANNFLIQGDADQRLQGGLVLGYTPHKSFELWSAILNGSNRNQRNREQADRDPELIKTFGDLVLGGKGILPISPATTMGFELGLKFLSGVSDLSISPGSTSWWLGPLFTYDMRRAGGTPVRLHAGASYYQDNSSNLRSLSGGGGPITRSTKEVAMFAYGIAPSRLRLALAVDAPLEEVAPGFSIDPFLEYHVEYVTSAADPVFRDFMPPNCGGSGMPCVDNRDMQWLTLGARAAVYRGLMVDIGFDIRIRSAGFPYGPPVAPYNVIFGVSYPLDLDSLVRTVVVTRTVEKPPKPTAGQVVGVVKNARGGAPIAAALVAVAGRARGRVASDADGGFATADLPAGLIGLEISAPDFEATKVATTVIAGKQVKVDVTLEPKPAAKVHGRVADTRGQGLEAVLKFTGQQTLEVKSGTDGAYLTPLEPGSYQVRAEAPNLAPREVDLDLQAGQDKQIDLVLRAFASNPDVVLGAEVIKLKRTIRFVGATSKLAPASEKILDAVADLLDQHSEIKRVRIEAHWDSGLSKADAARLTQTQADDVRSYLVAHGIAAGRLMAVGSGSTKPLVPNLTPVARARNRRVELHLQ